MSVALGLDLGNDKCVVAVARNGVVDVLPNEDSSRETPSFVHFSNNRRLFGFSAAASAISNPASTISHLKRLIGLPFHDPHFQTVDLPRLLFDTSPAPDGGIAVNVKHQNNNREFTATAMLVMFLRYLKRTAEKAVGSSVADCVVGIPSHFDDRQRRAYLDAVELAGLRPLRLMHEGAAAALEYGIYKAREDHPTSIVVFLDIGQSDTQVTVVCFGCGGMLVLAHASDAYLGGRDFDEVIFAHLAMKLKDELGMDVRSNARATLRLRRACEKAKKVLSANKEAHINEENLINGVEAKGVIKREEFEGMASDLLGRIEELLRVALRDAKVEKENVDFVELIGSGTRIPAISRMVTAILGQETSRTLNASECVARGCALQCAMMSNLFTVRRYELQDIFPFPITFSADERFSSPSSVYRDLPMPTTKILTVKRSEQSERTTLKIGIDYKRSQTGCSEVACLHMKGDCRTIKVEMHLNLHGILFVESTPFIKDEKMTQGRRKVPFLNTDSEKIDSVRQKLLEQEKQLEEQDLVCELIANKRNALEAYVYKVRDKINDRFGIFANDSVEANISMRLKELEQWIYEERELETVEDYTSRMEELKLLVDRIENCKEEDS